MKRIVSILLAISLFIPLSVHAATWITVSSWAYNSVSNFKNAGLLPDCFDEVTDYTQEITRLQFAELVHSVLTKSKCINYSGAYYNFNDTENEAARTLASVGIMEGETTDIRTISTGRGTTLEMVYSFHPDRLLTREEMAAVIYKAAKKYCSYLFKKDNGYYILPTDFYISSDWAQESIKKLYDKSLLAGSDNGYFRPKANLTIEQAVSVLYRLYNTIPTVSGSDGASIIPQIEMWLRTYDNGIMETRLDDMLYLRDGFDVLMSFETDIYTNIYCATHEGVIYAVAQNTKGRSDVYNTETKELLFNIPYPVSSAEDDCIITMSHTEGPMTFGVYSYDNKELLPPEYSLDEINTIKANGFKIPDETKAEASGWIYYVDSNDGNHLYKIDSNGENKQKLSDRNCTRVKYISGRVYFDASGLYDSDSMFSINPDGGDEQYIGEDVFFVTNSYSEWIVGKSNGQGYAAKTVWNSNEYLDGERVFGTNTRLCKEYSDNGWVYYIEHGENSRFCRVRFKNGDMEFEQLTDGSSDYTQLYNGKIYFKDFSTVENIYESDSCTLYCYDGNKISKVSDDVCDYGFMNGKLVMTVGINEDEANAYIAELDGSNAKIMEEIENTKNTGVSSYTLEFARDGLSDDKYTVFTAEERSYNNRDKYITIVYDSNGKKRKLADGYDTIKRIGDILYFYSENAQHEAEIARNVGQKGYEENNSKYSEIIACDMKTGRKTVIADNVKQVGYENADGRDYLTYTDYNNNIWRYNAKTNELSEIFPNKGITRYGALQRVVQIDGKLYKADTEGNYSFITDAKTMGLVYVENGAMDGVQFDWYR